MAPTLYTTDLLSLHATPISGVHKQGGEECEVPKQRKGAAKKERTPAQVAALAAARQKRIDNRKAEATCASPLTPPPEQECEAPPAPQAKDDEIISALRQELEAERAKLQALQSKKRPELEESSADELEPTPAQAPKRQKTSGKNAKLNTLTDDSRPPAWFENYLVGIKTEQAKIAKKPIPKRAIREAAHEDANVHWQEPLTRSRVNHEVDTHMHRLHSMIFGGR